MIGGKYSGLYCAVCGHPSPDNHHVKTKGAGGKETIPLCRQHHAECHAIGRWTFAEKYGLIPLFHKVIGERKYQQFIKDKRGAL